MSACGIAETDNEGIGRTDEKRARETPDEPDCFSGEMAEAVSDAIAATASESGEPDPRAVRTLHAWETSLAGVECLENLERLYVGGTLPNDELLRLIPLDSLHYLSLTGPISLEPLPNLPQLTSLSISSNDSRDLSPLAKLPALEELELAGMLHLSDISPLGEIETLRSLHFFDVQTEGLAHDYSFLANIQLEELSLIFTTGTVDFARVDTSRLRSLHLVGTDATNLADIGAPFGPPAEISVDSDDFSTNHPDVASVLCSRGWCISSSAFTSPTPIPDPACSESCGMRAD